MQLFTFDFIPKLTRLRDDLDQGNLSNEPSASDPSGLDKDIYDRWMPTGKEYLRQLSQQSQQPQQTARRKI